MTTKTKKAPADQDKLSRKMCKVCKIRFAFQDDGTCGAKECPAYSQRIKAMADAKKAERAALAEREAEGRAEQAAEAEEHERAYRAKMARDDKAGVNQMIREAEEWARQNPGAAGRADAEVSRQLREESEASHRPPQRTSAKAPAGPSPTPPRPATPTGTSGGKNGQALQEWEWRSPDRRYGILSIADPSGKVATYFVRRVSARGDSFTYMLTKMELGRETTYYVAVPKALGADGGGCGCPGACGHGSCKHLSTLRVLRDAGEL